MALDKRKTALPAGMKNFRGRSDLNFADLRHESFFARRRPGPPKLPAGLPVCRRRRKLVSQRCLSRLSTIRGGKRMPVGLLRHEGVKTCPRPERDSPISTPGGRDERGNVFAMGDRSVTSGLGRILNRWEFDTAIPTCNELCCGRGSISIRSYLPGTRDAGGRSLHASTWSHLERIQRLQLQQLTLDEPSTAPW
ncbi:cellobiose phosphorylase [Anopheles sinensis]|uniref:Cellobiose phosphorylase n=1 Tax=Anopheles sinensis TaxID=74873 RepID=A0A084VR46_ANOSI|nr:cellobiose phosphorylase [Anopheles sinensis]